MNPSLKLPAPLAGLLSLLILIGVACASGPSPQRVGAVAGGHDGATDYDATIAALRGLIKEEMERKGLPALSIALVDDESTVWSEGFGMAAAEEGRAATDETVYRVGSVSKLFTDIAVMQLVERGELELDAPVQRYLPEFKPENPFGGEITLRQLMSHRAALVREPPIGNYFDDTEPSLAETVASLNETRLVYAPETRTKYSNAGIATVGRVLERLRNEPFARYLESAVLEPLGMNRTSFEPRPDLEADLAEARMWTYDGRVFDAPTFQLGMAPAGSMYSTVTDLGLFLQALFAGGQGADGQVLEPETLESMWTPQYAHAGQSTGFGIGFAIGEMEGHRRIGHGGAIYGFATELAALPDRKLGVVVVTTRDIANAVTSRLADAALRLALAEQEGRPLPELRSTTQVPNTVASELEGRYQAGHRTVDLVRRGDTLYMYAGAVRVALRALGDTLIADDILAYGTRVLPMDDGLVINGDTLRRTAVTRPVPAPERLQGLIGEYGWDHNILYILEKEGQLHAQIEWFFSYPLEEIAPNVFRFPNSGLYDREELIFERRGDGRATSVNAASVVFQRRDVGTEGGETFRIDPVRPVEELRAEALAATPPRETGEFLEVDLVEPARMEPGIRLDVRYATTNNFMSAVFYDEPRVFLQRPAAEAVVRAHRKLAEHGYGLLIHDGYRPWYVTKMFWDATPESMKVFVANPADGSRHNRGAAVDLTMYDLETGEPVQMVGGYDEFSDRSYPDYPGGTSLQRWRRELLRDAMEAEGFEVYEAEWWHFDYGDWRRYPVLNVRFEEIDQRPTSPMG